MAQYPKTVTVKAQDEDTAIALGRMAIRDEITEQDFGGDRSAPMLSKYIVVTNVIGDITKN